MIRAGHHPERVAYVLHWGVSEGNLGPGEIGLITRVFKETLARGHDPDDLHGPLKAAIEHKQFSKEALAVVAPALIEIARAGQNPSSAAYGFGWGHSESPFKTEHVDRMTPLLVEAVRAGTKPDDIDELIIQLRNALNLKFTKDEFRQLCEHARLAWQGERRYSPGNLIRHALEASFAIPSLPETLRLQRSIIEKAKTFPTRKLTIRLWRAGRE
jgi:hypothetical protein